MTTKLYLIMVEENLFHPKYVHDLIDNLTKDYEVVGITLEKDVFKKGFLHFLNRQIHTWGIIGFFYIALKSVVLKIPDKIGLVNDLSLKSIAKKREIPFMETYDDNSKEHTEYLKKLKIDIIIASSGQLFKHELLNLPKIACINRHASLLPKYGGMLPVFWAMYFEEKEFGVSIHYMIDKFDQGDIIYKKAIPLLKKNSLYKNYIIAFDVAVIVTLQALKNVRDRKIVGKYYHNDREYFSSPSFAKIDELKKKGYKTFSISDLLT